MKKILLIEDEEQHIALVRIRLERNGYTVVPAQTAQEGITAALTEKPDLILTDLMLPDMGPEELLKKLRAADNGRRTPIMAFTALDEFEIERRELAGQLSGLIRKPYEISDLLEKINKALRV